MISKRLHYLKFLNLPVNNMVAELFIVPESFENNDRFTVEEIEEKVKSMAEDFIKIREHRADNHISVHSDVYGVNFINGLTLGDLLFTSEIGKANLDRDVYNALITILMESGNTDYSVQDIIEVLLPEHDEDLCHGLIAFDVIPNTDLTFQIIYSLQGWYVFRRHFLGLYPKDSIYFIDECKTYFPDLFVHERNKDTVKAILKTCAKTIIFHLAALNDDFRSNVSGHMNRSEILTQFSVSSRLHEHASLEGDTTRKQYFTFNFRDNEGKKVDVCCEPHLKLCYNDNYPGDASYSNNRRIYFHEGINNIQEGKILIGHIGNHL